LITISYLIGIPAAFIIGGIAAWLKNPKFGIIGIPLIYGLFWLLLVLGLYLAGPQYGKVFSRWTVRVILKKFLVKRLKQSDLCRKKVQEKTQQKT